MALLHLVSAKADHTDRPKPRNVALWRRESVLPGTISAESCSGGPPLSPRPSLSRPLFRYFGTICRQLLLSFPFDGNRPRAFAFFSAGFGWVRHWAQQTKREEGREKEAREEGRELVGLQQGGLGLSQRDNI